MNSFVHVPATHRFRSDAEREAEEAAAAEAKATLPAPPPEQPADLDTAVDLLDAELRKYDKLKAKEAEFPSTIADIESKLKELENQDLDTISALEARQAQQGKLANTLVLANGQAKKTKAAIAAQEKALIDIGTQANDLAQQFWGKLHTKAYAEAKRELERLFFRAFEHVDTLSKYRPVALTQKLPLVSASQH